MSAICWQGDDVLLRLRVQPRASRDEIVGAYGDEALKVRITAPPVGGKANAHLQKYLAKIFAVPRADVVLVSGETGRDKRFKIQSPAGIPEALRALM